MFKRLREDEQGNVSLLVAVAMVALLGCLALVADVGMIYLKRQQLQGALDSGALAGIQRILAGEEAAEATAREYVGRNGFVASNVEAIPNAMRVSLTGEETVELAFAQILGHERAEVDADVEAQAGVTIAGTGFVPIGVPDQVFQYGALYTLSQGAGDGMSGNYSFLDLPGATGASGLSQLISYGYQGELRVGQLVNTKTGINTGAVRDAIRYRINVDTSYASCNNFQTAASGCARIMYLPVIDSLDVSGTKPVTILGFAAFYLEGMSGGGGHQEVRGRFIRTLMPGELGRGNDYGVYSVKLTR